MGNHEFCTECGESDFHRGEPCDPAVKAAYQASRKRSRTATKTVDFAKPFADVMLENLRNNVAEDKKTAAPSNWEKRYREAETAWHQLKSFTKQVRLDGQTPEYKELSNLIHSLGRDVFYVNEGAL